MNTMGSHEYRSDKHPVHDRVDELEQQNKLMREAIENLRDQKGRHNTQIAYNRLMDVLAAVEQINQNKE